MKVIAATFALAITVGLASPAEAMGSGNYYQDHQTGVGYTVYQPGNTAGLTMTTFTSRPNCAANIDEPLVVGSGKKSGDQFTLVEADPRACSEIGTGTTVYTFTLRGRKARLVAYCAPSATTICTREDVAADGGYIEVTLPGNAGLRPTTIRIETASNKKNLTWQKLVAVARSLNPVR